MNDAEQRLESCKCSLASAELELQEKELELTHGGRYMDEAKEKYGKLKIAVELAKIKIREQRSYLEKAEADAAKGFISDTI